MRRKKSEMVMSYFARYGTDYSVAFLTKRFDLTTKEAAHLKRMGVAYEKSGRIREWGPRVKLHDPTT